MPKLYLGSIVGLVIGTIDVLLMIPMAFPDKRAAMLGAFASRFAIGFFAGVTTLPLSPLASGLVIGLLVSVPDAIITKAYVPIIVTGLIFGAAAGWVVHRWGV